MLQAVPEPLSPELEARLERARQHSKYERLDEAVDEVVAVLAERPDHAPALVLRAEILVNQGDIKQALGPALQATLADPDYADAYLTLGVVRQETGNARGALEAYERYLELQPAGVYARSIRREVKRLKKRLPREG